MLQLEPRRLSRIASYHDREAELIRVLPRVIPSDYWIDRDLLHDQLVNQYGIRPYTKAALSRRLKDLGYSVTRCKAQRTRRDYRGVKRKADATIYGPDWDTGQLRWLTPDEAARAWDAPRPVGTYAPMAARLNKEFEDLCSQNAPDIDLSELGIA